MAMTLSEWRRENSGTPADYEAYLSELAGEARRANEDNTTCTRDQALTAIRHGIDLVDAIANAGILYDWQDEAIARLPSGTMLTHGEVGSALNGAADELDTTDITGENSDSIWQQSVVNLAVNAAGHLLRHPEASLFEVIAEAHADTVPEFTAEYGTVPAKGTPEYNEALYETVTGWIA
jgi:hypothetical protein